MKPSARLNLFMVAFCTFCAESGVGAQTNDEMMVYSVKGDVSSIFNNKATPVKIGTLLLPSATIKTGKDAAVTMVCRMGRPISLTKEGSFPLASWKDSCAEPVSSVTANYFRFVWNSLYKSSLREGRDHRFLGVSRGNDGDDENGKPEILFSVLMDTVFAGSLESSLSWKCSGCRGPYRFSLYDQTKKRLLFRDTVGANSIVLSRLRKILKPNSTYWWTVSSLHAGTSQKRMFRVVRQQQIENFRNSILGDRSIPDEAESARYFRAGYLLQQAHYVAEALACYKMATQLDPSVSGFRDVYAQLLSDLGGR